MGGKKGEDYEGVLKEGTPHSGAVVQEPSVVKRGQGFSAERGSRGVGTPTR